MKVILREELAEQWTTADAFDRVREIDGPPVRAKEGRRTLRFESGGRAYYLKHHRGVGWGEVLKSWLSFRAPVTSARNEWEALNRLKQLNLLTLEPVAYGNRGLNPASQESFLITRELTGTESLEDLVKAWPEQRPAFVLRQALIDAVADITRKIHQNGINHRDLYLCHFLLAQDSAPREPRLYLVDLHRAQLRKRVPRRWLVKDLASIYFSSLDIDLDRKDVLRFLRRYFDCPLRELLNREEDLLAAVKRRALRLYVRDFGHQPTVFY
ncbi:lipopolysaccharide core heptose(I) kinase RfaP [Proteobacteria bacterium 005FR1]|nr:lipopolysaccharide core heptose(I) kinase RfaP [Proteobacteria bacterium 005FR1]